MVAVRFGGIRPAETASETLSINLTLRLLDPLVKGITKAHYHIYRQHDGEEPLSAGNMTKDGEVLRGFSFVPAQAIQSLLVLLCSGKQMYLSPTVTRFRYRKAQGLHLSWCTEDDGDIS